jgi:oligopeptide transport system ATP-binding protein
MEHKEIILSAQNIEVKFNLRGQVLTAIRDVSLDIYKGETLAIVGESGSGKSVFTKTFNGLLDKNGTISKGELWYGKENLVEYKKEKQWLKIRGHEIAMIMQEPMTALNPLKTIGAQIVEAIRIQNKQISYLDAKKEAIGYLEEVGIKEPERRYRQYPHEFSGGMRQRVVIAIAIACKPKILICDEPTTALDVTIQAQILKVLKTMKEKYNLTIVFITHDLGVVANVADRIAVMYAGDIIEIGMVNEVFFDPRHPYTWALLSSMPQLGIKGEDLFTIQGNPPNLFATITGDAFAPRNPYALKIDYLERPPYFEVSKTHKAKTWLLDPRAPRVEKSRGIMELRNLKAN